MKITYDEQLTELNRELAMRRRLYPQWIERNTLKQDVADRQIARLEAAIETVRVARQAEAMTGMSGQLL